MKKKTLLSTLFLCGASGGRCTMAHYGPAAPACKLFECTGFKLLIGLVDI